MRTLFVIVALILALPASAQQWDQVNGSMQVKSGPTAPLVIIDQTASGQRIVSFRANGTEVCFATSTVFSCTGGFTLGTGGAITVASAAWINTAPTVPVACTTPTVTWSNGTAAFQIDVGTTCAATTTLAVTLPAAANAWSCSAINVTASATAAVEMTASTATSATFTNFTRTTGTALAWVDGADVRISCIGG
jgi:hypothetical protein